EVLMIGPNSELPAKTYVATVATVAEVNVMCGSVTLISKEKPASETAAGPVLVRSTSRVLLNEGELENTFPTVMIRLASTGAEMSRPRTGVIMNRRLNSERTFWSLVSCMLGLRSAHFSICFSIVPPSRQMRADPRSHEVDVIYIHNPVPVDIANDVVGHGPSVTDQDHIIAGNIAV